ncbi:MAG: hypothetical protein AAB677_01340 [Patescibacteria group bacterium]
MSHILSPISLKNYWEKIKSGLIRRKGGVVIVNFFLIAGLSFGLGRLTKLKEAREPIRIEIDNLATTTMGLTTNNQRQSASSVNSTFVGSKNGTKYHYPWCPGAVRIKEENKVWFTTVEDARRAGYTPAANCPGL